MRINIFWMRNIHLFFREICEYLCLYACSHLYPYHNVSFYAFSRKNLSLIENENENHASDDGDLYHSHEPYSLCCPLCHVDSLYLMLITIVVGGKSIKFAVFSEVTLFMANIAFISKWLYWYDLLSSVFRYPFPNYTLSSFPLKSLPLRLSGVMITQLVPCWLLRWCRNR